MTGKCAVRKRKMLKKKILFFLSLNFLFVFQLGSSQAQTDGILYPPDDNGRSIWKRTPFRIMFNLTGEHAVRPDDVNNNDIPDISLKMLQLSL